MKTVLILLALTIIVSCEKNKNKKDINEAPNEKQIPSNYNFYIKKIDGCEYIILQGAYAPSILHKENCSNHVKK